MNERDFKELYQQEPAQPTDEYKEALRLWCEYFYLAERYDRILPHFINERGDAIVLPRAQGLSNRYAQHLRTELKTESELISKEVLQQAKIEASRYSFETLQEIVLGGRTP